MSRLLPRLSPIPGTVLAHTLAMMNSMHLSVRRLLMGKSKSSARPVQTDLATMLGIMQDLCPDDDTIVACLAVMMDKGVIRKPTWISMQGGLA
jgi:hypothetical protein